MLGLGVSLAREDYAGGWLPSDEASLEAWYKYQSGITLNGSDVSAWADSSSNSFDMVQATASKQPGLSSGNIIFDASQTHELQATDEIVLDGAFVIGFSVNPDIHNVSVLASQVTGNEMVKLLNATTVRLKNDSSGNKDFTLSSGDVKDKAYWVIARDGSNNTLVYKDGTAIAISQSVTGTFDIDSLGARQGGTPNYFDGVFREVVIFKGAYSLELIANLNVRLLSITTS